MYLSLCGCLDSKHQLTNRILSFVPLCFFFLFFFFSQQCLCSVHTTKQRHVAKPGGGGGGEGWGGGMAGFSAIARSFSAGTLFTHYIPALSTQQSKSTWPPGISPTV